MEPITKKTLLFTSDEDSILDIAQVYFQDRKYTVRIGDTAPSQPALNLGEGMIPAVGEKTWA